MNPRAILALIAVSTIHFGARADLDLCQAYMTKTPALAATFTVGDGQSLRATKSYSYVREGVTEIFTLRKDAAPDASKGVPLPWPLRDAKAPSIKRLVVTRSPGGKIEDISDGRTHLTFQYDENGKCVPEAIFSSLDGKKETATLMASTQVCASLSGYLKNNPMHVPCVQGDPSVIDATLARHDGNLKDFLRTNPKLNNCMNDGRSSGVPLFSLLQKNAAPFVTVDGVSDIPKSKTLTESLEGAHALWHSCKQYAIADYIGEIKPASQAPSRGGGSRRGTGTGAQ